MVDPDRLRRLLGYLESSYTRLLEMSELQAKVYFEHPLEARYAVQSAAQCCVDIANHLISSEGWRVPKDYRDVITVLEENRIIPAAVAANLRELVGMRNLLVHLYDDVDDSVVRRSIIDGVDDLRAFARAIAALLDE